MARYRTVVENPYGTGGEIEHRNLAAEQAAEEAENYTGLGYADLLADLLEDGEIVWTDEETGREVTVRAE